MDEIIQLAVIITCPCYVACYGWYINHRSCLIGHVESGSTGVRTQVYPMRVLLSSVHGNGQCLY